MGILFRRSTAGLVFLLLTACATVQTYEMSKAQATLAEAVKNNDMMVQKAQADFTEKQRLIENLSKTKSSQFRSKESDLRGILATMQTHLNTLITQRKQMLTANSEVVSMSYNRKEVHAGDPQFNQLELALSEFQTASDESNRAMAAYSAESNALTDMVDKNKLLIRFNPSDFLKRVQERVLAAQEANANMQHELDWAEQLVIQSPGGASHRQTLEHLAADMQSLAQTYTQRAQRLQGLAKDMRDVTADVGVTSLDPEWPQVQRLVREFEQNTHELGEVYARFNARLESFRAQTKRSRKN